MKTLIRSTLADAAAQDPISPRAMHAFIGAEYGGERNFTNTSVRQVDGPNGRTASVLNQHLKAGTFGMPGPPGNGTGISLTGTPLPRPYYEAAIEFDLRYVGSGRWPLGMKIPGLGGVLAGHGNSPPTGGAPSRYGFSARLMARRNKDDETTGALFGYLYRPLQTEEYGIDLPTGKILHWNTWYHIKQTLRMNAIYTEGKRPKADGVHQIYVDGDLAYESTTEIFRLWYQAKVTHLPWDIFCGGHDASWCPETDLDVQTTNLVLATNR
jgi:hypothetical protein